MKVFFIALTLVMAFSIHADARPLTPKQIDKLESTGDLRTQMDKMIISIADLDILVNRDKTTDYEIFKEDAERILSAITEIRKLDTHGIFEKMLKKLEVPTQKLLKYSKQKNEKALEYPEKIFNACFECHKKHRSY